VAVGFEDSRRRAMRGRVFVVCPYVCDEFDEFDEFDEEDLI